MRVFDFDRNGKLNTSKGEKLGQVEEAYERGFQNGFQMSLQESLTTVSDVVPNLLLQYFEGFLKRRLKSGRNSVDISIWRSYLYIKMNKNHEISVEVAHNGKDYVLELRETKDRFLEGELDTDDLEKAFKWIKQRLF